MFQIGQRVVCVDTAPVPMSRPWVVRMLRRGTIYVVRGISLCEHYPDGPCGIWVDEIRQAPCECCCGMIEPAFLASRFRPVTERSTDISVFKTILDDANVRAKEKV